MDSSGISALCLARQKLEADGIVLVLGAISPQAESTLQMVGLDMEFVRETRHRLAAGVHGGLRLGRRD
jgi:anti-anti-sigma regulatory factor